MTERRRVTLSVAAVGIAATSLLTAACTGEGTGLSSTTIAVPSDEYNGLLKNPTEAFVSQEEIEIVDVTSQSEVFPYGSLRKGEPFTVITGNGQKQELPGETGVLVTFPNSTTTYTLPFFVDTGTQAGKNTEKNLSVWRLAPEVSFDLFGRMEELTPSEASQLNHGGTQVNDVFVVFSSNESVLPSSSPSPSRTPIRVISHFRSNIPQRERSTNQPIINYSFRRRVA